MLRTESLVSSFLISSCNSTAMSSRDPLFFTVLTFLLLNLAAHAQDGKGDVTAGKDAAN